MSIMTTEEFDSCEKKTSMAKVHGMKETTDSMNHEQLTVSAVVNTMLEIIKVKKSHNMDEETRKQFPCIAQEIMLLAEQTQ